MQHKNFPLSSDMQLFLDTIKDEHLKDNFYAAFQALIYARNYVDFYDSFTQPALTDRNRIFPLRKKIKSVRKEPLSLAEAFEIFFLTAINDQLFDIKTNVEIMKTKKNRVGNCYELSVLAFHFLTKKNIPAELISIINGDHVVVIIDRNSGNINDINNFGEYCVVLDVLNNQVYPASMIYKNLHCYEFDKTKENPHILIPFTESDQLMIKGSTDSFISIEYNQILVKNYIYKLNIIQKYLENNLTYPQTLGEITDLINTYQKELDPFDFLLNKSNNDIVRYVRKKMKTIHGMIKRNIESTVIKDSENFMINMTIAMFNVYHVPKHYFENLIIIKPLFSIVCHHIKNNHGYYSSELKNKFQSKTLLESLLIFSLKYYYYEEAVFLLEELGGKHTESSIISSTLKWAIEENNNYIITSLLNVNIMNENTITGLLPLHFAIQKSHDVATLILNHSYSSNDLSLLLSAETEKGETALYHAVKIGNIELVKKLLNLGASLDIANLARKSLLHLAVELANMEIIKHILDVEPKLLNAQDFDGYSALHIACKNGQIEIVKELITQGANPYQTLDREKTIPLLLAVISDHTPIVTCILDYYPNLINSQNSEGYSSLHFAIINGNVDLVSQLLKRNADPKLKTCSGTTPLMMAKSIKSPLAKIKILKYLQIAIQKTQNQYQNERLDSQQFKKIRF